MKKPDHLYQPHLTMREFALPAGKEWCPQLSDWSLVQVKKGHGYWLQNQTRAELAAGTILLLAGATTGRVLVSQLNTMTCSSFTVIPDRLTGLLTFGERDFFRQAATQNKFPVRIFPPLEPLAIRINELCAHPNQSSLLFKLRMLEIMVEAIGPTWAQPTVDQKLQTDARERLQLFLREIPLDALLELSFADLARETHCTSRHLSRIFSEVVGMSFNDKRAEIRLVRARDLLATSQSKVVDVALESGYKSLSLFNQMFTRRFGISPGKWRDKNGVQDKKNGRRSRRRRAIKRGD
jgi:AraC-like DNA-binding protein